MAASADVLRACIPLLFEKAVAEPTFCALYADLSSVLSTSLADYDFGSENGKPVAFRRELLNTCQVQPPCHTMSHLLRHGSHSRWPRLPASELCCTAWSLKAEARCGTLWTTWACSGAYF